MQTHEPNLCSKCGGVLYIGSISCEARQRRIKRHWQQEHPKQWVKMLVGNGRKTIELKYVDRTDDVALFGLLASIPLAADIIILLPKLFGG